MKAIVYNGPRDVAVKDVPDAKIEKPTDVLARISVRTGMFNPAEAKYANGVIVELPYPTDDTRLLTRAALEGVERVYREGFRYSKAEVLLLDLSQRGEITGDLFAAAQPVASEKLMGVLDTVNARWGRGTMRLANVPVDPS